MKKLYVALLELNKNSISVDMAIDIINKQTEKECIGFHNFMRDLPRNEETYIEQGLGVSRRKPLPELFQLYQKRKENGEL